VAGGEKDGDEHDEKAERKRRILEGINETKVFTTII